MAHKAYAFDWKAFEQDELFIILPRSLECDDVLSLVRYIQLHYAQLKDPYEGEPLDETWQEILENKDVHEYADFTLTRFYDPDRDLGIGEEWIEIDESLSECNRSILLGFPLCSKNNVFDPGRMGSYFQTPERVLDSLRNVRELKIDALESFQTLLEDCSQRRLGLYVTF
ncbi:hypothetical protein C7B77_04495 [Chamaesiphon polymorphus CCALA 037]|uniref:DUF1877 domain-containing protein n=2 Tax=Chamaesiphon TaxID=217161 RepID=A0A2T1GL00_9CYAN|nr:hypothetical protein C7B77_04495 [Chamaesiphon polymorphus CCALA 037]